MDCVLVWESVVIESSPTEKDHIVPESQRDY